MSKIALTPNANGSGVFTLASPNSNTNRTITLPDESVTLGAGTPSIDDNGNATALTIDSSENVLVGKTSSSTTTAGNELRAGGLAAFTRSGSYSLNLNRLASDGDIAVFQKDNTTVGTIGAISSNNLIIANPTSNHSGVVFGTNTILPAIEDDYADGLVDLGNTSERFRDAYLSGGVYLGGTGSANKLDDVETGLWTATIGGTSGNPTSVTYLAQASMYTKVGDIVTVTGTLGFSTYTGGAGTLKIVGLPYTAANVAPNYTCGACLLEKVVLTSGYTYAVARTLANQTYLEVIEAGTNIGWRGTQVSQYPSSATGKYINFTVTYRAA